MSFTNYNMFGMLDFVGIENYKTLFLGDEIFIKALGNTLLFAVIVGPFGYFLSFFAAWVLNMMKFRNGFALIFYAPSIISGVAMSVVWSYIFSPDSYGLINNFLISLGIADGSVRVRYLRMTARGRDGSAGGEARHKPVCGRRRASNSFHRRRHLEGGFVDLENEPFLVNLVVGGDFLVRQMAIVETNAVDGAKKARGIGGPFADNGRRSGRAPVVTA